MAKKKTEAKPIETYQHTDKERANTPHIGMVNEATEKYETVAKKKYEYDPHLDATAREAADASFDVLIACAFNYDAHASEVDKLGRIPVLKERINADLHMADNLKNTGEVRSDGPEGIACWFIDTDYNEESFFVRHAYFLGANDPYKALKTTLKAEINADAWASLHSDTSRPFTRPESRHIAVKVINHLNDEVIKMFRVS